MNTTCLHLFYALTLTCALLSCGHHLSENAPSAQRLNAVASDAPTQALTFSIPPALLFDPESASQLAAITVLMRGRWHYAPESSRIFITFHHTHAAAIKPHNSTHLSELMDALLPTPPAGGSSSAAETVFYQRATRLYGIPAHASSLDHQEISRSAGQLRRDKKRLADYVREVMVNKEGLYPTDEDKYLEIRRAMLLLRLPR